MNSDIIELQSRIAYLEDALQTLNNVIARQDAVIMELQKSDDALNQKLSALSIEVGQSQINNQRPPHY